MMGHNIRFKGVIRKIIPKLLFVPLLFWSTALDISVYFETAVFEIMRVNCNCFNIANPTYTIDL